MGMSLFAAALGAGIAITAAAGMAQAAPVTRMAPASFAAPSFVSSAVLAPSVQAGPEAAIQPVYWARDRFGRRVWVEPPRRFRPPPRRRGWVDRWGRWHPY